MTSTALVPLRAGELQAWVAPAAGMLVTSMRHRGEELLAQRADVGGYVRTGLWTGSPLLYPWANRLSASRFPVRGREVDASASRRDEQGTPLHGLPAARRDWVVEHAGEDRILAHRDWDDPAFPFPHRVTVEHRLEPGLLRTTTDVAGDTPVAFGWHPFLRLPGEPRSDWEVELGTTRRLELDGRNLPTGAAEDWRPAPFRLGVDDFDLALGGVSGPFTLRGRRRRLVVTFEEGAPYAQFFAPVIEALASFEPMAAPGDALVTGRDLPSAPWRMRFSIAVHDV